MFKLDLPASGFDYTVTYYDVYMRRACPNHLDQEREGTVFDKFREECGVFGVFNHPDAANLTYLGLYALQHRGQESAGMVSSDGTRLYAERGMGYVSDIFNSQESLKRLPGRHSIGHVRYSTAGSVSLREAQPFVINCHRGQIALCHNGNLPDADQMRNRLEKDGAIFSSTSDTEVVLHMIARSKATSLYDSLVETFNNVEGAFSMLLMTPDSVIAVRDPRGFRPLSIGQLDGTYVFASETCAFDLIGATYLREVEPGEIVALDEDGLHSSFPLQPRPITNCVFEHV